MIRLGRLLGVRAGEGTLVALLAGLFATVEAGRGIAEVAADTLFLDRFGAGGLPYLYIGLGIASLVVALGYGAGLGRLPRRPFLVGLMVAFATTIAAERIALGMAPDAAIPVAWLSVYIVTAILLTVVWTVAAGTLDARQAKRLFPVCTSAAIAGGFAGTLGAGPLARIVGVENLLVVFAGLVLLAGAIAAVIIGRFGRSGGARRGTSSIVAELRAGFDYVRVSPLMRLVAVAYLLFAVLLFSLTFPFMQAVGDAFPDKTDLASTLGLLSAGVTAASFLVSILIANRVYARLGVATAALVLPLVYLGGFGLWLVQFNLATAIAVRFAQQVAQRGLSNAAWSAMYSVLPPDRRPQVLAFIDGVPGQLGTVLSGVLLLVIAGLLETTQIFVLGAIAAALCTWVVLAIRRRYGEALVRTLRAGLAEQVLEGGPGLAALCRDTVVVDELLRALRDPQPGTRRLAADLLGRIGAQSAWTELFEAAVDPEPEVRAAAIDALAGIRTDPEAAAVVVAGLADADATVRLAALRAVPTRQLAHAAIDGLAADPDPRVRSEIAMTLVEAGETDRARGIVGELLTSPAAPARAAGLGAIASLPRELGLDRPATDYLADRDPSVRAMAATAVAAGWRVWEAAPTGVPPGLVAALDDPSLLVRRSAASSIRHLAEAQPAADTAAVFLEPVAARLADGSEQAQEAALMALTGSQGAIRDQVRDWAIAQAERAGELRRYGRALTDAPPANDGAASYLAHVVGQRERRIVTRLIAAIAALGAEEADGPIRRSLRSRDPDIRAQAVEALDAIGDRRLGRAVVRLLDAETGDGAGHGSAGADDTLRSLAEDPDPWIRRLALRSSADRLAGEWQALSTRAASDPDPIVREALAGSAQHGGPAMPETERTLAEIDRMLFLRRVPLFSGLAPEDLQRVAASAVERLYAPGEALVREGDTGEELVVIVEGDVSVVRGEGPDARVVRSYTAGDHVGELALLRDRPRAATVLAGANGVRGLVIGGEGLRAILAERPEAAMAMLATLAERISQQ